jgi:hypothetical protein
VIAADNDDDDDTVTAGAKSGRIATAAGVELKLEFGFVLTSDNGDMLLRTSESEL